MENSKTRLVPKERVMYGDITRIAQIANCSRTYVKLIIQGVKPVRSAKSREVAAAVRSYYSAMENLSSKGATVNHLT